MTCQGWPSICRRRFPVSRLRVTASPGWRRDDMRGVPDLKPAKETESWWEWNDRRNDCVLPLGPDQVNTTATSAPAAANASPEREGAELQLVSFEVGGEEFGLDIVRVQEIIRMQPITRVPN